MIRSQKTLEYQSGFEKLLNDLDKELKSADKPLTSQLWKNLEGTKYEKEVFCRLEQLAVGTCFERSIKLVSGQKFPDIISQIANEDWGFGVEAKTTKKNVWKSTGSSIVESTRVDGIEKVYISFAKLGGQPEFITKPYEACLSGVAVTHSPRYTIDMMLNESETIFSKIGKSYEEIRCLEKPFEPFKHFYTKDRDPDSVLWWADHSSESTPPILRVWSDISHAEREILRLEAFLRFPEVLKNRGRNKYNRTSLWLASSKAIVASSLRDLFSAGGQEADNFFQSGVSLPKVVFHLFEAFQKSDEIIHEAMPDDFDWADWSTATEKALMSYDGVITQTIVQKFLEYVNYLSDL